LSTVLVTGSSGLVGSACVRHFAGLGWEVHGIDNGARRRFFGGDGDTSQTASALGELDGYTHHSTNLLDRDAVFLAVRDCRPDLLIHAAAQPSHDYATKHPLVDWDTNAGATMSLLEATRQHAPAAAFVFLSTNKVYGDTPNRLRLVEKPTRWDYEAHPHGVGEWLSTDQSRHSIFGASKLAADVMVQEYGRTYGMKTVCFRAGCLTGGDHAGAELHGFLAYLARCVNEGRHYRVYGHKGKQVRDQLHADDVARACEEFADNPKVAAVYNLGGGKENSISVLEAIDAMEQVTGKKLDWSYVDEPRGGDHICYYTDTLKFRNDYPDWSVTRSLESIIEELCLEKVPA
jgi:CDP-paratose 2-epimerase